MMNIEEKGTAGEQQTDIEHQAAHVPEAAEQPRKRWEKRRPGIRSFISVVSAGLIGSVLTLGIAVNTPYFKAESVQPEKSGVSSPSNSKSYELQSTSSKIHSLADMVEVSSKAIVGIVNKQSDSNPFARQAGSAERGTGSGVIFKKDKQYAYIVTNNHVVEGAQTIEAVVGNGERTSAELVGRDALSDLAVLRIHAKYAESILEFGDSDSLRAGDQVVAIGNPLGLEFSRTVTQGIVSAVNRTVPVSTSEGQWNLNVIQTDAAINPGNSGGALINSSGKLVGINSLKIADNGVEGLGFAIPSNDAVPLIEQMLKKGKIERPYMGVSLADLSDIPYQYVKGLPANMDGGTMVTGIDPKSSAALAGLKVQDVIVSINGQTVNNSDDLRKYLYSKLKAGDKVSLRIYRGSKAETVALTLAKKP